MRPRKTAAHAYLVVLLRDYLCANDMLTASRLPNELWCTTWEHLSTKDCLIVAQVCHDWRMTACDWSRLWTQICYFHEFRYKSAYYEDENDQEEDEEMKRGVYCVIVPRIPLLRLFLARSGGQLLDVEVSLFDSVHVGIHHGLDMPGKVAQLLFAQHAHRLGTIKIWSNWMTGMSSFILYLPRSIPSLTRLHIDGENQYLQLELDMNLPLLKELILDGSALKPAGPDFELSAPSLRLISAAVDEIDDIIALLIHNAVPHLQDLTLKFWHSFTLSDTTAAAIKEIVAQNLQRLCLNMASAQDESAMSAFYRASIPDCTVHVSKPAVTAEVSCTLADVPTPFELTCYNNPIESIYSLIGSSKQRTIIITESFINDNELRDDQELPRIIWSLLDPAASHSLLKLTLSALYLQRTLAAPPFDGKNNIREFVISIQSGFSDGLLINDWLDQNKSRLVFPNLDTLALTYRSGRDGRGSSRLSVTAREFEAKLSKFLEPHNERQLGRLEIRNVQFQDGDFRDLVICNKLAREIVCR